MQPEEVRTSAQARAIVEERGLTHVRVGVFDIDGILRGKYMDRPKFFSALDKGMGFCDVVLGWDSNDPQYDNISFTGWHTAYPDAAVRLLPETCRALPFEGNMLLFLGEFTGHAEAVCPRGALRRVLERAATMGYGAAAAAEYRVLRIQRDARRACAKKAIATCRTSPRECSAIRCCAARCTPSFTRRCCRSGRGHAHADRRPAHRDRAGRARGGAALHRGARSGRPRRAVQDLRQGARPASRPDGDLHGQVVAAAAGPKRASPRLARPQGRRVRCSTTQARPHGHVAGRCAGSSAASRR